MSTQRIILLVAAILCGVAVFVVALVWGLRRYIGGRLQQVEEEVRERYQDRLLRYSEAQFFGLESKGVGQVRGTGLLVLLDDQLLFRQLEPEREIHIPFDSVRQVDTTHSHLTKTRPEAMLRVRFLNENGQDDVAVWLIPRVESWMATLDGQGLPVEQ